MITLKFSALAPLQGHHPPEPAMSHFSSAAMRQYRQNDIAAAAVETDPRKLIEMLLAGVLDRLAQARGSVLRGDCAGKHHYLSSAISIIEHLRLVLDLKAGGELAENLMALYSYMLRRLPAANIENSVTPIDEVADLLRQIKGAWDGMPAAAPTRH